MTLQRRGSHLGQVFLSLCLPSTTSSFAFHAAASHAKLERALFMVPPVPGMFLEPLSKQVTVQPQRCFLFRGDAPMSCCVQIVKGLGAASCNSQGPHGLWCAVARKQWKLFLPVLKNNVRYNKWSLTLAMLQFWEPYYLGGVKKIKHIIWGIKLMSEKFWVTKEKV